MSSFHHPLELLTPDEQKIFYLKSLNLMMYPADDNIAWLFMPADEFEQLYRMPKGIINNE